MYDFERGAKVTGSKFYFNEGNSALSEWNLIDYMIKFHVLNGSGVALPRLMVTLELGK